MKWSRALTRWPASRQDRALISTRAARSQKAVTQLPVSPSVIMPAAARHSPTVEPP